jgi:hypothetical protein
VIKLYICWTINISPNIISDEIKDEVGRARGMQGREKHIVFVGKPEGKTSLGRPRHRWILKTWEGWPWTRLMWLRTGTSGELF